ncbi:hypothetical protein PGTUg99_020302 [Puccinia graminis f. sp. tritici]|uniref:Uncharacterized protein n=1 Tax=Puccinia graminis f. sp. tritici TaxID=56615 RepID=A0A5B0SH27_PUCGR|nr:hypothetical protein PGTUg99_020302 [Puccinia graminis f. sp. tritici]
MAASASRESLMGSVSPKEPAASPKAPASRFPRPGVYMQDLRRRALMGGTRASAGKRTGRLAGPTAQAPRRTSNRDVPIPKQHQASRTPAASPSPASSILPSSRPARGSLLKGPRQPPPSSSSSKESSAATGSSSAVSSRSTPPTLTITELSSSRHGMASILNQDFEQQPFYADHNFHPSQNQLASGLNHHETGSFNPDTNSSRPNTSSPVDGRGNTLTRQSTHMTQGQSPACTHPFSSQSTAIRQPLTQSFMNTQPINNLQNRQPSNGQPLSQHRLNSQPLTQASTGQLPNRHPSSRQPSNHHPSNHQPSNRQPTNLQPEGRNSSNAQQPSSQAATRQLPNRQPSSRQPSSRQPSNRQASNAQPANNSQPSTQASTRQLPNTPPSSAAHNRLADETSTHDAGATEHPSGPSEQATSDPVKNGPKAKKRMRLDSAVFNTMKHLPCDQLRKKIVAHARYKRLVAEDRVALEAAYNRFQTEVHLIALERLLKLDPVWKHIGNRARFRGPTNYNNFCEYDIEARKVYYDDNIPVRQRKKECGRLWRLLDKATKLKYKDIDFLAQLPNPFGRGDCPGPDGGTSQASRKKARRSRFFREAETELWSRKVMLDLKNLGAAHDVEGFVMLYKSKGTTSKVVSGGSIMGEQFVDMCAKEKTSDIGANFLSFASGQELIKRMTGSTSKVVKPRKRQRRLGTSASAYDKGSKEKNLEAARGKLNQRVSVFVAVFCYATLRYSAFSGKSGQKPLKSAVAQRSGPFFAAHTRSVSGVVAESRYATLKLRGIPLRYAALTATVSVAGPALVE